MFKDSLKDEGKKQKNRLSIQKKKLAAVSEKG